jgi:hypothetical protein
MAKRYDNLFQEVVSFENLYLAFRKAMRGKRANPRVAVFELEVP